MVFAGAVDIGAVESYDGDGEDELDEMEYGEEHIARSHRDEPHLEQRKCCDASAGQVDKGPLFRLRWITRSRDVRRKPVRVRRGGVLV